MIDVNDFFDQEKQCVYRGEIYSVRNNGAIMRHARPGKAKRKNKDFLKENRKRNKKKKR